MSGIFLLRGKMFDGVAETLSGPMEIVIEKESHHRRGVVRRAAARRGGNRPFGQDSEPWIHRHSCSPSSQSIRAKRRNYGGAFSKAWLVS